MAMKRISGLLVVVLLLVGLCACEQSTGGNSMTWVYGIYQRATMRKPLLPLLRLLRLIRIKRYYTKSFLRYICRTEMSARLSKSLEMDLR